MKVLFLAPYPPWPPSFGGSTRIYHLMRQVARRHEVHCLCYESPFGAAADRDGLRGIARSVVQVPREPERKRWRQLQSLLSPHSFQRSSHHSPRMQRALDQLVQRESIHAVVVEFSQMACFDFPRGVRVVVDEHNVEWDLLRRELEASRSPLRRAYNAREWVKFRREELASLAAADAVTVTSERDRELLLADRPRLCIEVVPNGVDTEFFRPSAQPPEPGTLVFTGAMHYHPNAQAAEWFVTQVLPLVLREIPHARFIGAGGNVPRELARLQSERVRFTGFVDDIRDYFRQAQVCVVPLLVGGGTRFKVVEGLAAGKPVVSTRLGSEGIPVTHGENVWLADDPREFAAAVVELCRNPERAAELAAAGRRFVERAFAWDVIGERMSAAIERGTAHGLAA